MRHLKKIFLVLLLLCFYYSKGNSTSRLLKDTTRYNVLFLCIDDLRPELNCYGVTAVKSPNIDGLARQGVRFNKAYCQQPLCGPSRASILTGLRPDSTKIYDLKSNVRTHLPNVITLPEYFKNNGYFTASLGKVFHVNDPQSWSVPAWNSNKKPYALKESYDHFITSNGRKYGPILEKADVPDSVYVDGDCAQQAVKMLNNIKGQPFFLAVGFFRPHLPFVAPAKYWNMYNAADFKIPDNTPPKVPEVAVFGAGTGELRQYAGIQKTGKLNDQQSLELIHGYYASISYMDAQVGIVLRELKRLGLDKNTIVILWGDHGWKLGEYGMWGKRDNMETDCRAPVIISAPHITKRGAASNAFIEFIDIYPTLCEAAGLPVPEGLQGQSFNSLLSKPNNAFKPAAFSQNIRPGDIMGYSMRTKRFRYTEYHRKGMTEPVGYELYDEVKDPKETVNQADNPAYANVLNEVRKQFKMYGKNGFNLKSIQTNKTNQL